MLTFLYRAAWAAAPLFAKGQGKTARTIRGRLGGAAALEAWAASSRDTSRKLVWFHAASVGEGRQAEAVMIRLRRARPDWQVAYTFASASAERFAKGLPADVAAYLPADTPREAGRALDALKPATLVFSATDLWPVLVREATRRGIPVALVSAALAPTSSRRGGLARALLSESYRSLAAVGAVDAPDAEALAQLGVPAARITVTGDTRHDSAAARAAATDRRSGHVAAITRTDVPVLVAGSTWPADEAVLVPSLALVRRQRPLAIVVAPHEPDATHLAQLERRIAQTLEKARVVRLSNLLAPTSSPTPASGPRPEPWDVCLVDRVGVLAELYAAASIAYVGGGFHKAGLHSVIEPAALGVPVLVGPRWQTSRDARLLLQRGGAAEVHDAGEMVSAIEVWLSNEDARRRAGTAAKGVVDAGVGAAERTLELVLGLIEKHGGR